jgi:VWFA-related protein
VKQRRLVCTSLLTALLSAPGGGFAAQHPEPYRFGEVVDVQLVNVEAWVTDGGGNSIKGLSAADFEILEDGEPVEVTHFAEIDGDRQVLRSIERVLAAASREASSPEPPAVDPNHLVIYFDELHLKPAGRNRLIDDLRDFLAAERVPAERVLILDQDHDLTTEAAFGSSWQELDAALERIAKTAPAGGRVEMEKRLALQRLQDIWNLGKELARGAEVNVTEQLCQYFLPRAEAEVELYARESRQRISLTMDHLASAASFLTGVPGVKTLLYLSDSLERSPGSDLLPFINGLCPAQDEAPLFIVSDELSLAFRRLTRHANANRVTIYALQAEGLQGSFIGTASQRALEQQSVRELDTAVRVNERDGLSNLAAETGGRTVFNRNDFDGELTEIAREMESYYSLAYVPPHGGDGLEHRIEVRVKDSGFGVRHRRGYRDKSPDVRMTERLQGAVYLGLVENPMGVRLGAGDVRAAGGGRVTVPLHVMLPSESVAFLPEEGWVVAHLSVQIATRNMKSGKGIFDQSAFRVRRSAATDKELVSVMMELNLPEGVHLVAVGLRDDATRESSFVTTTLQLSLPVGEGTV